MIIYNLTAPPGLDTLTYIRNIQSAEGIKHYPFAVLFPLQFQGTFLISLPGATGATPLCYSYVSDIQVWSFGDLHQTYCTLMHTGWPIGVVLLWIISTVFTVRAIWFLYRLSSSEDRSQVRPGLIRYVGRFALLLNAVLVLMPFLLSPAAAYFPVPDMRYLVGFLVTTPALLWPLWTGVRLVKPLTIKLSKAAFSLDLVLVRRFVLVLVGVVFLSGTVDTVIGAPSSPLTPPRQDIFSIVGVYNYLGVPQTRSFNRQEQALMQNLLHLGATRIYSDYWTCDRLIFRSQEQIVCSAARMLNHKLRQGQNRYIPYCQIVQNDPLAAYVFPVGSPEAAYMQRRFLSAKDSYDRYSFNGYLVIRPKQVLPNNWHCSP